MNFIYDLIIIGAGPGGYRAAEYAAKQGLKVVIFEGAEVGGTCLNVGCIPTKTYVHSSSFDEARERMATVVPQLRAGVEGILSNPNITLIREKASFATTPLLKEGLGKVPVIIATGSVSKLIPVPGIDSPNVVDSTGLLNLDTLPKRLCIIGAGVIGMEFASVFNRFGAEVTVIEFLKECLPALDSDIAKRLRKQMEKEGITFNMQCGVKQIADGEVFFENKKGQTESVKADVILVATGRKPRTEGLNLETAGITLAPNGTIPVDEDFKVSTLRGDLEGSIYAIGDVNGKQMLAHAAEMQGIHVVNRILGKQDDIHFEVMPAAIFTNPEAACVGPSEDQLKEAGVSFECHKSFYRANGKALAMNETEGMVKLCTEPDEGRILSAHIFGAHAADLVQEVTAYITLGATLRQLRETVHIHPTLSEVLIGVN
ncbi:MAG: NAD(P)/FAD-dependent oxidoreductase [Bacteroidaceae bacterium]|nr:NAD(P)/FAD-dependent oxidoreductase [Bacteroidaceae bacterium]